MHLRRACACSAEATVACARGLVAVSICVAVRRRTVASTSRIDSRIRHDGDTAAATEADR